MKSINFEGRTRTILPKPGQGTALHVKDYKHLGEDMLMSVWEPTDEERKILATGGVVLLHVKGNFHPPLHLAVSGVDKEAETKQ